LRIAQLQFAGGDLQSAGRTAERILADYPFSDVRAHAAYWAGRVRLDRADLVGACDLLRQALGEAGDDVELANRAAFYVQRCDATAPADTAGRDSTATPAPSQTVYSVQVAAVQSAAAADELMRSLTAAGFESHVVREESLFKVRVGRFTSRDSAQRVQREVRQQFGGSPFIIEER